MTKIDVFTGSVLLSELKGSELSLLTVKDENMQTTSVYLTISDLFSLKTEIEILYYEMKKELEK